MRAGNGSDGINSNGWISFLRDAHHMDISKTSSGGRRQDQRPKASWSDPWCTVWFRWLAMGVLSRAELLTAIRNACLIGQDSGALGVRPNGVVRIDTSPAPPVEWAQDTAVNQARPAETSSRPRRSQATTAKAGCRGEYAGEGCTLATEVDCSSRSTNPRPSRCSVRHAHTLLYTLGENAPEDRILSEGLPGRIARRLGCGPPRP